MEQDNIEILLLLRGCLLHDRASQKKLYHEFYSYGMSVCLRYANNRDEAAEILNDGFMKLFKNINKFDLEKPFKPWLRKILVNISISRYHQRKRQLETEELNHAENDPDTEKTLSGISYDEMISLLRKLSPAYGIVFNLHVIEGYTHEEIGMLLNISPGTSKSNLFKAKEQLRKIMSEFFENDYVRTR